MRVGQYAFYGASNPKRRQSKDNEMGFLKFKKEHDEKRIQDLLRKSEQDLKKKEDAELEKKHPATVVSSLTNETNYPSYNSKKRLRHHQLQKQNCRNKQVHERAKYHKVLVLGTSHKNKFLGEYKSQVNNKSSKTDYTMANGKLFPSKVVSDDHYDKHLPNIDILSERYSSFKT